MYSCTRIPIEIVKKSFRPTFWLMFSPPANYFPAISNLISRNKQYILFYFLLHRKQRHAHTGILSSFSAAALVVYSCYSNKCLVNGILQLISRNLVRKIVK